MSRVASVVVGGLLLSGCALPVPLQIASWALDGFSMLVTQKSVTDHGISLVTQQDCALWRGVTEGAVCRDDDPMAIIAAQGDVSDGEFQTQAETGSAFKTLQTMLTSSSVEPTLPAPSSWSVDQEAVSDAGEVEPVQVASSGASEGMSEPQMEPPVKPQFESGSGGHEEDRDAQWQFVSQETSSITASKIDGVVSYDAIPGDYFVIGSFGVWKNAKRYMEKYPRLDARILAANIADYRVFRIVVGPYNEGSQGALRRNIKDAGIDDTWAVRVPADENTMAWRYSNSSPELASIPVSD